MPTQVVSASVLARPVHPILPNRRERANVAMRQVLSSALSSGMRAWVLIIILQFVPVEETPLSACQ